MSGDWLEQERFLQKRIEELEAALDVSERQRAERERVFATEIERLTEAARLAQMQADQAVCVADEGIAEVERLTALLKEADDERLALKEHYPKLRSQLAAAQGEVERLTDERDGLAKALETIAHRGEVFDARGTHSKWVCGVARAALAALPTEEKEA